MVKVVWLLAVLCSVAGADTFRFDHARGHLDKTHDHRCASPKATKRLLDFVNLDPKITVGHDQMTVTTKDGEADHVSSADSVAGNVGRWLLPKDVSGGQLTVLVDVLPFGWCTKAATCAPVPEVKVSIIQRFDGAECYESWRGDGVKL